MPKQTPAYDYLPASLAARLPRVGETSDQADPMVEVKLFTPDGGWSWFIIEYDPDTEICYGLVDGLDEELGTFSLAELRQLRGQLGLPVERDLHFAPRPLSQCRRAVRQQG